MSQSHLVIDFPIKAPANAKALTEELPPLMPDLAKVQDDLGTVHFSRFMVEGDEKLLFLSDIDGEGAPAHRAARGACRPALRRHLPTRGRPSRHARRWKSLRRVVEWLKDHVREPVDTYFAYEDASVQDIKACARAAGFTGNTSQGTLLTYMSIKPEQGLVLMEAAEVHSRAKPMQCRMLLGRCTSPHWVLFEDNHLGFFTIYDGDFEKYIQDFAEKTSIALRRSLSRMSRARRPPQ